MKKITLIGVLLVLWGSAAQAQTGAAEPFSNGVHFTRLVQADSPRRSEVITVTELFSYGCHACNDFEPYMQNWKSKQASDVKLNRIPVGFGRAAWQLLAKGYVIAEIMGIEEENHLPLMNAIWRDRRQMRTLDDIANFYAEQGADKEKFLALDGSFMLDMRQKQNDDKLVIYAPRGTPTMVVNGRYKVQTGQSVPSYDVMLSVVDYLVQKERLEIAADAEASRLEESATSE